MKWLKKINKAKVVAVLSLVAQAAELLARVLRSVTVEVSA